VNLERLLDRLRRAPVVGVVVLVIERFGRDGGSYLAASITFYLFVAALPLALLAVSVTGFALEKLGAEKQAELIERVATNIPALGPIVRQNLDAFTALRGPAGIVAVIGIIWGAAGAGNALRHALSRIFGFDMEGAGFMGPKLRTLGFLSVLLLSVLIATGLTGIAASTRVMPFAALTLVAVIALDFGVAFLAYRIFTPKNVMTSRDLLGGALIAAVGLGALSLLGTWYTQRVVLRATIVFGTFAGLIGILVLLNLSAMALLYGAEFAALRRERAAG